MGPRRDGRAASRPLPLPAAAAALPPFCCRRLVAALFSLQAIMAHITAVRLKAFKSVAGGWQEFRFDRGLNAIVGA